jgi:antirestriction protein ArdC
MKTARNKINEMITQRIIERIEKTSSLPWKKPWTSVSQIPRNLISMKPYRGVNVFLLHCLGYTSPFFLTFKQAQALGGTVRKGEKSCPIVFWRIVDADKDDPKSKGFAMLRYYRVFNVSQCEGIEHKVPVIEVPKRDHTPIDAAEMLVADMPCPPKIGHGRTLASYSPSMDTVCMPCPEWFVSGEHYYGVIFHELAHSTGHKSRLSRKAITEPNGFGSHAYSQEELVAEMTATFLCSECGILSGVEENSAAYLSSWLKTLKADPSLLIKAGSQAQKAFDYIIGEPIPKTPKTVKTKQPTGAIAAPVNPRKQHETAQTS